jgi:ADP-heptose:LPS heptosyltransferase
MEVVQGYNVVQEVKFKTGFDKVVVIQPFGRGVQNLGDFVVDGSSRSLNLTNTVEIINELKKEYAVILMSEFPVALEENDSGKHPVAMPQIPDLRIWSGIIDVADHFIGCDSVGQHIARALGKTATVITGSTFPVNISYPECNDFDIIDLGSTTRRYSPIRISMEDHVERANDEVMEMTKEQVQEVIQVTKKRLGKSTRFKGEFKPADADTGCCDVKPETAKTLFSTAGGSLKPLAK